MRNMKCAPIAARSVFGDQASAQPSDKYASHTPATAAERRIEPRLPGSCIDSSKTQKRSLLRTGMSLGLGISTNAIIPVGVLTGEISWNKASLSTNTSTASLSSNINNCFISLFLHPDSFEIRHFGTPNLA